MKSTSKKRTPSIVNLTVKRRYLTQREIERLMDIQHAVRYTDMAPDRLKSHHSDRLRWSCLT
jgi:hypothetical protein